MKTSQKITALQEWIEANCTILWSLLNTQAQKALPQGLIEYTGGGNEIERIENNLRPIENVLGELEGICGFKFLGETYRRDFSGVTSGNQVEDLFCELSTCASLGKISDKKKLTLRPPTVKGTYSDCLSQIHGFKIYSEVKRYRDPWPPIIGNPGSKQIPNKRSIGKSHEKPFDTARPRSMDLKSKLHDLHRQFPDRTINVLFIFHQSLGESQRYLTQAFFGDNNFFSGDNYVLYADGLFSKEEWRNISACCFSYFKMDSSVTFQYFWKNPRAYSELPKIVLDEFKLVQKMA